jgi:CheY-like chemotaxis protein
MAHVLVVENDKDIREILRVVMEDEGFTVAEEADGGQALSLLKTSPLPLVVLLDLSEAVRGQHPLLGAIEADPSLAQTHRIIVMTALTGQEAERAVAPIRPSLAGYITKPFDLDELLLAVDKAARSLPGGNGDPGSDHLRIIG